MNNQKTAIIGIAALILVALLVYHFSTDTAATTDYGITAANIDCDGDYYVFTGTFNTWRVGLHQVQVFCDDDASKNILNFYEKDVSSSGSYNWQVTRHIDDFDDTMPCDEVWFQLYDADASVTFFRTEDESVPECGTSPTPTPTPDPDPDPDPIDDTWIIGGIAAFLLLLYLASRKKPPITPRRHK